MTLNTWGASGTVSKCSPRWKGIEVDDRLNLAMLRMTRGLAAEASVRGAAASSLVYWSLRLGQYANPALVQGLSGGSGAARGREAVP